ncbi:MAG: phosphoserine phosphatase SerB [Campylobacteraceae bacterium 4484_166]|nr:MAG: phosphoserine phosphatase SerB [Campylobacteraceae bacterium 4484_166]
MKLAVFDFDSTLMDGETIDILAFAYGVGDEIKTITDKAMAGEIDFYESLKKRVSLLRGMPYKEVQNICKNLPYIDGAKETIKSLQTAGYTVVCLSGGFRVATKYAKNILGFDAEFSNILHQKDGYLTGQVGGEMMFEFSKGDMINRLQTLLKIDIEDTITIGDGANDISMFDYSSKKVAFCAKPALQKKANIIIKKKNLTEILKYI